jgi:hypothetical protein
MHRAWFAAWLLALGCGDGAGSGSVSIDAGCDDVEKCDGVPNATRYADSFFASTHNSYSGGARGTLMAQFELGVRFVELDIHDDDFTSQGYRVGHDSPGHQVAGDSDRLVDWLEQVSAWSAMHPEHAPITLLLDLKDSLADRPSFDAGNLGRLIHTLEEVFGDRLARAERIGGLTPIAELRGRIVTVLSGHQGTRLAHRRSTGRSPAVAVNGRGQVVEVHDAGDGTLWYWTGELLDDGEVRWARQGRYDGGDQPAVALNDDGVLVEVHHDPDPGDDKLWYRVGQLGDDLEITWTQEAGRSFPDSDTGERPSVRFLDRAGLDLVEIHEGPSGGLRWTWSGSVNLEDGTVSWSRSDDGQTEEPRFDTDRDGGVEVSAGAVGSYGADSVRYRVSGGTWRAIRYPQILFTEVQPDGDAALAADEELWFFAAKAASKDGRSWAAERRSEGRLVRLWGFNSAGYDTAPPVNLPATDFPSATWYAEHCRAIACVE